VNLHAFDIIRHRYHRLIDRIAIMEYYRIISFLSFRIAFLLLYAFYLSGIKVQIDLGGGYHQVTADRGYRYPILLLFQLLPFPYRYENIALACLDVCHLSLTYCLSPDAIT
jgi:hypothetical protein